MIIEEYSEVVISNLLETLPEAEDIELFLRNIILRKGFFELASNIHKDPDYVVVNNIVSGKGTIIISGDNNIELPNNSTSIVTGLERENYFKSKGIISSGTSAVSHYAPQSDEERLAIILTFGIRANSK